VETDDKNIKAARQWYEKALPISVCLREPGDLWMSYRNLGDVSKDEGDPKAAQVWYEKALAIAGNRAEKQPDDAQALKDLSRSYLDIGNVEKAREWKTRADDIKARAERKK
jgi:tetratricopeptide (TPR) repeat protein